MKHQGTLTVIVLALLAIYLLVLDLGVLEIWTP